MLLVPLMPNVLSTPASPDPAVDSYLHPLLELLLLQAPPPEQQLCLRQPLLLWELVAHRLRNAQLELSAMLSTQIWSPVVEIKEQHALPTLSVLSTPAFRDPAMGHSHPLLSRQLLDLPLPHHSFHRRRSFQ